VEKMDASSAVKLQLLAEGGLCLDIGFLARGSAPNSDPHESVAFGPILNRIL